MVLVSALVLKRVIMLTVIEMVKAVVVSNYNNKNSDSSSNDNSHSNSIRKSNGIFMGPKPLNP